MTKEYGDAAPITRSDRWLLFVLIAAVVVAAWAGGGPCAVGSGNLEVVKHNLWGVNGTYYWSPWFVGATGFFVLVFGLFCSDDQGTSQRSVSTIVRENLQHLSWTQCIFLPWLGLVILQLIGLVNPSLVIQKSENYPELLLAVEHYDYLPTTVDVSRGLASAIFAAGVMAIGAGTFLNLRSTKAIEILIIGLFLNGVVLTVAGFAAYFQDSDRLVFMFDRLNISFFSVFQYKNHWVGYAMVAAGCGGAWLETVLRRQGFRNSAALLMLGGIFWLLASLPLKGSRAGALLLACAFGFIVFYVMVTVLRGQSGSSHGVRFARGLLVLLLATAVAFSLVRGPYAEVLPSLERRSRNLVERFAGGELDGRIISQRYCLRMTRDRPLFGWGIGSFKYLLSKYVEIYPKDLEENVKEQRRGRWSTQLEFAHNDYLQALAEFGIAGVILLLAVPIAFVTFCVRFGRRNPLTFWCWSGCAFVFVLAWIDYPFWHPAVSMQVSIVFFAAGKYALLKKKRGDVDVGTGRRETGSSWG